MELTFRRVTSEEVDGRLGQLITNMLYMFHVHITDSLTGSRYAVGQEILEAVRAIRDVRAAERCSQLTHSACTRRLGRFHGQTSTHNPPLTASPSITIKRA